MNRLILSAGLLALVAGSDLAVAGNASGTSASGIGKVTVEVDAECSAQGGGLGGKFTPSGIVDSKTGKVIDNADLGLEIGGGTGAVSCNGAGAILGAKTENGGITLGGAPAAFGVPVIFYQASITMDNGGLNERTVTLNAVGTPGATAHAAPTTSPITSVAVAGEAHALTSPYPLSAGTYTDTLTIQVGDAL